jgi:hypothetical protein
MKVSALRFLACVLPALLLAAGTASAEQDAVRTWRFDVSLDGRRIGEHSFVAAERDGVVEIESQARFTVNLLFVPVYRYEHRNREVWRDGCLARIDARTLDNGEELRVRGELAAEGFSIQGPDGAATLPGCIKTFAYWDPRFLAEERLLNAQTGEYETVRAQDRGTDTLLVAGRAREAHRHTLEAAGFQIDLWYSPQGEWLGLESRTPEGRRLRYDLR